MATDIGRIFEKELEKVFRSLKESHLIGWHRLPDTSAAGGHIIGEQPSDYILALPPGSVSPIDGQRLLFVEVKASEKHSSLNKSMMQPAQRGAVSFYRTLLQLPYLILFYDAEAGTLQVWDGAVVVSEDRINKHTPLARFSSVGAGTKLNGESVAQALLSFFKPPEKRVTLASYCA